MVYHLFRFMGQGVVLVIGFLLVPLAGAAPEGQALEDGAACLEALAGVEGSTCSVLYWIPEGAQVGGLSILHPSDTPDVRAGNGNPGLEPAWQAAYLHMWPVRWKPGPEVWNARGPASPVDLVPDASGYAFIYLSADAAELRALDGDDRPEALRSSGGALMCLTMEVLVLHGVNSEVRKAGEVVMRGTATRTVVSAEPIPEDVALPASDPCPGAFGPVVVSRSTEFQVELEPVPGAPTENLTELHVWASWHWHEVDGGPLGQSNVTHGWNLRSGPDHRPRVVLPVLNPVSVAGAGVERTAEGTQALFMEVTSPWGNFEFIADEVDTNHLEGAVTSDRIRMTLLDRWGHEVPLETLQRPWVRYESWLGQDPEPGRPVFEPPLRITFQWSPDDEPALRPGPYTAVLEADNRQGTATARAQVEYQSEPQPRGPARVALEVLLPLSLAGIAGLVLLRRAVRGSGR